MEGFLWGKLTDGEGGTQRHQATGELGRVTGFLALEELKMKISS